MTKWSGRPLGAQQRRRDARPHDLAVRSQIALLGHVVVTPAGQHLPHAAEVAVVVGVRDACEAQSLQVFARAAEDFAQPRIGFAHPPVGPDMRDADVRQLEGRVVARFARAQRGFGAPPLALELDRADDRPHRREQRLELIDQRRVVAAGAVAKAELPDHRAPMKQRHAQVGTHARVPHRQPGAARIGLRRVRDHRLTVVIAAPSSECRLRNSMPLMRSRVTSSRVASSHAMSVSVKIFR